MNMSSRVHTSTRSVQVNIFIVMETNHIYAFYTYILYSIFCGSSHVTVMNDIYWERLLAFNMAPANAVRTKPTSN